MACHFCRPGIASNIACVGRPCEPRAFKAQNMLVCCPVSLRPPRKNKRLGEAQTYLWLVGNGRMVVIVLITYNCTPFLHSLLTKGKQSRRIFREDFFSGLFERTPLLHLQAGLRVKGSEALECLNLKSSINSTVESPKGPETPTKP